MALRLIIENLDGVTTMVPLNEPAVTIGRTADNTIQLSEQNVSRRHAQMVGGAEGWHIEDRASYNGVMVNGVSIAEPTPLREGDLIQIGDYHLVLTDSSDKQTLDLQRPRRAAASRDEPVLASSSADLPRLTPSEVAMLTGEARAIEQVEQERKFPWAAVAIAVACIAVMAIAATQMLGNGDDAASADVRPRSPNAAAPVQADHDSGQAAFPGAAAPVEDEFPLAELLPTSTGDEDDESDKSHRRARKRSSSRRRSSSEPRSERPVQDAKIVLRRARSASSSGKPGRAYALAEKAYEINPTDDALFVMGKAACQLRQPTKARRALRKLDPRRQPELVAACERLGVEL